MSSTTDSKNSKNNFADSYTELPDYYDLLYKRFFKTIPDFVRLVADNTPKNGEILDLAAGTGEVSLPLLRSGFSVSSLDKNPGMLKVLKAKAVKDRLKYNVIDGDILSLPKDLMDFDTICIRQAINYALGQEQLVQIFSNAEAALKDGGALIFNAPNFREDQTSYPFIENRYKQNETEIFVLEENIIKGRLLTHRQYTTIWGGDLKEPVQLKDANQFYLFSKEEFKQALTQAGFSRITFYSSGLEAYQPGSKTLYGVAQK